MNIDYQPDGPTLDAFMCADDFFRCIVGPFGSGKSAACAIELFRRACQQAPDRKGVRRTKWAAIRATYRQLERTTIATWAQWFPDAFAPFRWNPTPQHHLVQPLADGTILDMQVDFIALDGPSAEADLRGLEVTGAWLNEVSEIDKGVVTFLAGRVGRFPAVKDGGPTWSGIVADSNAWDQDHWLHALYLEPPQGWLFSRQPGAVLRVDGTWQPNPAAENLRHLPPSYYTRLLAGQAEDWIRVYLANEFGYAIDGRVVYPEWSDSVHVAPEPLAPIVELPLYVGLDFGLTPAAIFAQKTARGQWRVIDEFCAEDMGVARFAELLNGRLDEWYGDLQHVEAWADPAGNARAATDERSCIQIVRNACDIPCRAAPSNDPTVRREAVAGALNRLVDGKPGFLLSPACKTLRKGFSGGYHFRRLKVTGEERYVDKPDKNSYSHPHDALQYLMLGAGEGRAVLGRDGRDRRSRDRPMPTRANSRYNVLGTAR